jgi:hypothetical protein
MTRREALAPAGVLLFGLGLRIWLILHFPVVFGGDTILHLANRDCLLLSYQLPLLQAVIFAVSHVTERLIVMRMVLALIGALSGVGFYLLARVFVSERSAAVAALLFTANPFLAEISIVPFQETLMLASVLFAFAFYFRDSVKSSAVAIALGCMTRFEAWIATPLLAIWNKPSIRTLILFGFAPVAWIAAHQGLSQPGSYVVEMPQSFARFQRWIYMAWIAVKNTPAPVLLLAAAGLWKVPYRDRRLQLLAAYIAMFLVTILISAHGVAPDPERYVTSRESVLLIAMTMVLVALGIEKTGRMGLVLASIALIWCLVDDHRVLRRDTSEPHLQLSYQLAQYLDHAMQPGEQALIVGKPLPLDSYQGWLKKIRARQGEAAAEQGLRDLAATKGTPADCWRTIVHSDVGESRISCTADPKNSQWIAVWSDSGTPTDLSSRVLQTTLRDRSFAIDVYR